METAASGRYARRSAYLARWVQLGLASGKVIKIEFPRQEPEGDVAHDHPLLDRLVAYLDDGATEEFPDVTTGLTVPSDHRDIYETVRTIPYGTDWTPHAVAERTATIATENGDGAVAVREALRVNPVPIVVPGHRVANIPGAVEGEIRRSLRDREGIG